MPVQNVLDVAPEVWAKTVIEDIICDVAQRSQIGCEMDWPANDRFNLRIDALEWSDITIPAFDMKPFLTKRGKISKKGGRYTIIPFKWHKQGRHWISGAGAKPTYAITRRRKAIPLEDMEEVTGEMLTSGAVHKRGGKLVAEYLWKARAGANMFRGPNEKRYFRENPGPSWLPGGPEITEQKDFKLRKGEGLTFRTVSSKKSPPASWWYPARKYGGWKIRREALNLLIWLGVL